MSKSISKRGNCKPIKLTACLLTNNPVLGSTLFCFIMLNFFAGIKNEIHRIQGLSFSCSASLQTHLQSYQMHRHRVPSIRWIISFRNLPNEFKKSVIFFMLHVITSTYSRFAQSCWMGLWCGGCCCCVAILLRVSLPFYRCFPSSDWIPWHLFSNWIVPFILHRPCIFV